MCRYFCVGHFIEHSVVYSSIVIMLVPLSAGSETGQQGNQNQERVILISTTVEDMTHSFGVVELMLI